MEGSSVFPSNAVASRGSLLKRVVGYRLYIPLFVCFVYDSPGRQIIRSHICVFTVSCFMVNSSTKTRECIDARLVLLFVGSRCTLAPKEKEVS
jgi:hypothetical protein